MFGIGLPEMLVIGLIAILAFGPDRLPEFVRTAARLLNQARGIVANAQMDLREELGPQFADLETRELDPHTFVRKHLFDGLDDEATTKVAREAWPVVSLPPYDNEAT
ncbi:sec-independent translocase [Kribbella catacumbae]|uniref:sec-independent translocase n=1 Tax=Kribbella catacumbae TaxID=460086 RepID=UPI0003809D17|nr:sec-independent translocase [Kribbella catacumbae]